MDESKTNTVSDLDITLASISRRLDGIKENLNDGIYGEMPKNEDSEEKSEMATPSLQSMKQRIDYINSTLSTIEIHVNKIHQSGGKERV